MKAQSRKFRITATPITTSAMIHRCLESNGYSLLPSTESIVNRKICGVSEFNIVVISDANTAMIKYLFAPVKNLAVMRNFLLCAFIFYLLAIYY